MIFWIKVYCTVTRQDAVLLPSAVVTVITAVPSFIAVTTPFSTVATLSLSELQVTSFSLVPVTLLLNERVFEALIVVDPIAVIFSL